MLATLTTTASVGVAQPEPPRTLRIDLFHTGGRGVEIFAVDRVVIEPLPWPGHPSGNLDPTGWGIYRFEVIDAAGATVYSRGFSSIFAEWETTAEAAETHRTFHESLRFPAPEEAVIVVISRRDARNDLREVWRTRVDPGDPFVDPSAPPRLAPLEIEVHGAPRDHVDLLLLGDGYTAEECADKFPADAQRLATVLFRYEPFTSRREDFNVWGLCPPAAESGISRPSTGIHRRAPVGTTYDVFGSERYALTYDNRALRDAAAWAPYELLEILINEETYGGGGIHNQHATVSVDNDWAEYIFIHELAHHFAALADEYYTSPVAYQPPTEVVEPWEPNVTTRPERGANKWSDLLDDDVPLPTPWPKEQLEEHARGIQARRVAIRAENRPESEMSALFREQSRWETALFAASEHNASVGAFQGANYDAQIYYRPQLDCVMFSRNQVPFCAPCQRALERVIDLYAPR
ncbi:MAG TPA: M64 family metallopeptidase [Thermoanaerobaculia bacterium]|nr:M64 family metallopeptidase [Thermoanaerobaculia bacterium]